ncbi:MAG: indolepyruvate ferredoxin oxidoreductase subunit alpha, partial [Clostridium sp.]
MATKLLMGNEAIALGAIRAGVQVVSGYPGTPSTEVLETVAKHNPGDIYVEWSVNEKSAMEVAAGAAYAGARSMVTMKQVGLNVASDPLMSLEYVGVKGGMVVMVADDPGPISSQTEQDTRHFAHFSK